MVFDKVLKVKGLDALKLTVECACQHILVSIVLLQLLLDSTYLVFVLL
jgi:hypothetical protein